MSGKKDEASDMRRKLDNNADERNHYINMALGDLSDADKVSNPTVLNKKREIVKDTFRGEVNLKNGTTIANGVQLKHINEYMDSIQATRATPPSQSSSS